MHMQRQRDGGLAKSAEAKSLRLATNCEEEGLIGHMPSEGSWRAPLALFFV